MKNNVIAMILCGGKGTRMNTQTTHKVCFDILGKPSILHAMERYEQAGISQFVCVVGNLAEQVMRTVSTVYPDTVFAFQPEPNGTGNAVRHGFSVIEKIGYNGAVLVTMGDKIVEHTVVKQMMKAYTITGCDAVIAAKQKENHPGGGVLIEQDGHVVGIAERLDVKKAQLYEAVLAEMDKGDVSCLQSLAQERIGAFILKESRRTKMMAQMAEIFSAFDSGNHALARKMLLDGTTVESGGRHFTVEEIENAGYANAGIYLFTAEALSYGLSQMSSNNAQNEEYFTEAIARICNCGKFKSAIIPFEGKNDILSYNNAGELLEVQEILRENSDEPAFSKSVLKPVSEWLSLFEKMSPVMQKTLAEIYGVGSDLDERRQAYIRVLCHFKEKFGEQKVIITRAPGRANLMGRHIDTRGGKVNVISINREVIAVAAPNKKAVRMSNADSHFEDREFNIDEHFKGVEWDNWLSFIESDAMNNIITAFQGDWMNYVKAPIIRLQHKFKNQKLMGMDIAFYGNIPPAAGLSSSSAVVVATAEAAIWINQLGITPSNFVDLCGEGEWFAGLRGGAGDHAAMKYGKNGHVTTLSMLPFTFEKTFPFPEGYRLMVVNSHIHAGKATNAKDTFNQRIAAYEFGLMMLRETFPLLAEKIVQVRDVNPDTLQVKPSEIYEMIATLPESLSPMQVFQQIPKKWHKDINRLMMTHNAPETYLLRSVVLYGVCECLRANLCSALLLQGDVKGFGKLMFHSHDGDRVAVRNSNGEMVAYDYTYPDAKMKKLIADIKSEDPKKVSQAALPYQGGGYACSTPEIDLIVDTAKGVKGVLGAQISGAGMGGCVMILAEESAVNAVKQAIDKAYFAPRNLKSDILVCVPVAGSQVLEVTEG